MKTELIHSRKMVLLLTIVAILGIFAGAQIQLYIQNNLLINTTESLPQTLFRIENNNRIEKGDYVVFCPTEKILKPMIDMNIAKHSTQCLTGYEPHLKIIGAVENDYIKIENGKITVNGKTIQTNIKPYYKYLSAFQFKGKVPKNMIFVYGINEKSYDSRYYGFISKDRIIKKAKPIF